MQAALSIFLMTLRTSVEVLQFMMFLRAVMSWLPALSDSSPAEFLFTVTEWVIMPVRSLFDYFGKGNGMMIDIPFFVTFLLLSIIGSIL